MGYCHADTVTGGLAANALVSLDVSLQLNVREIPLGWRGSSPPGIFRMSKFSEGRAIYIVLWLASFQLPAFYLFIVHILFKPKQVIQHCIM